MKTLIELRELRAAKIQAQEALVTLAEQEAREFTEAEKASFDQLTTEVEAMHEEVRRAEQIESLRINKAKDAANRKSPESKLMEKHSLGRAVNALVQGKSLTGAEAEMTQEADREAREAGVGGVQGVGLPTWALRFDAPSKRTDWNVSTPADGGLTVQTDVQPIVEALRPTSVLSTMGITVRSGLRGNLRFPLDTAGAGAWEGETDENANYSPTIGYVDSSPKRFGAMATLSKQLLAQSTSISDQYIRQQLERTIGTAIDIAGINGAGSTEPLGILNTSGINVLYAGSASASGTNADGAALTWGDITKLFKTVAAENVDMMNLYYLTTPGVFEQGSSTPRQTSGVEGNFIFNETMRAYGLPIMMSTNVPSDLDKGSSTDLHAMIFGNFAELALHQWSGVDLVLDAVSQAHKAQVRVIANIWTDWCITRPKAFAAIKDILV